MRHPGWTLVAAAVVIFAALPDALHAQADDPPAYVDRALRIEPGGFFTPATIVQGQAAEPLAAVGQSHLLRPVFAINDSAAAFYESFLASANAANRLVTFGSLFTTGGAILAFLGDPANTRQAIGIGALAVGATLTTLSHSPGRRARRSLATAIWWYNADLAR